MFGENKLPREHGARPGFAKLSIVRPRVDGTFQVTVLEDRGPATPFHKAMPGGRRSHDRRTHAMLKTWKLRRRLKQTTHWNPEVRGNSTASATSSAATSTATARTTS
jgi:hypothetical protein